MNRRIVGFVFSSIVLSVALCAGKESVSDAEIQAAVKNLSSESSEHSFDVFYKNPQEATRILIAELKPTTRRHYLSGKHPQAVWIVRALRSLTGVDFRANTAMHLTDDEVHFLGLDTRGTVAFFGTWMSRDSVWVAPKDAQITIVKEWREWFERQGHGHKYVCDRNVDNWYF